MNEAARQARNAYYKAWRAKNKDRVRQSNERYWAKKAAQKAPQEAAKEQDRERAEAPEVVKF